MLTGPRQADQQGGEPGSYPVIAGVRDRSPYQRQLTLWAGETATLDLRISLPTGAAA